MKGLLDREVGSGYCYFQVRPERASIVIKVTQLGNGSQPGLCTLQPPSHPHTPPSSLLALNKQTAPRPWDAAQEAGDNKSYQTACKRQPQISVAK